MFVPFFFNFKRTFKNNCSLSVFTIQKIHAWRIKRFYHHDNDHNYSIYSKEL